jgi:hypothetical protein
MKGWHVSDCKRADELFQTASGLDQDLKPFLSMVENDSPYSGLYAEKKRETAGEMQSLLYGTNAFVSLTYAFTSLVSSG